MKATEQQKASAAIFVAASEGKEIEWNHNDVGWIRCNPFVEAQNVVNYPQYYRIKPEPPAPLPWGHPDDVPGPVCWLRPKGGTGVYLVTAVTPEGVETCDDGFAMRHPWATIDSAEHSTDRCIWYPCAKGPHAHP